MKFEDIQKMKCKMCGSDTNIFANMEYSLSHQFVTVPMDKDKENFIYKNDKLSFFEIMDHKDFVQYIDVMFSVVHKNSYHKYVAMVEENDIEVPLLSELQNINYYEEVYLSKSRLFRSMNMRYIAVEHQNQNYMLKINMNNKNIIIPIEVNTIDIDKFINSLMHDKKTLQKYLLLQ